MAPANPTDSARLTIGLVAGEVSGDNLGAPLIRAIKRRHPHTRFIGIGGPAMMAEGMESWVDLNRLAVNGFVEPLKRLPRLLKIWRTVDAGMRAARPDCFVGIDFNLFNLLLEGRLRRYGIKTAHYVSPTVWAWRAGRIKKIRRSVDLMLTLYPFETAIYARHGVAVKFVGHPKAREISPDEGRRGQAAARARLNCANGDTVVAILPGSRRSEVDFSGPDFLAAAGLIAAAKPGCRFLVASANPATTRQIEKIRRALAPGPDMRVIEGRSIEVMTAADVVLVNSGTATLEAMLLKKPMVMSYRTGRVTYAIMSKMVTTRFFALPNILAGRQLIPELLQDAATPSALSAAVVRMSEAPVRAQLEAEFERIHQQLRARSDDDAADAIVQLAGRADSPA